MKGGREGGREGGRAYLSTEAAVVPTSKEGEGLFAFVAGLAQLVVHPVLEWEGRREGGREGGDQMWKLLGAQRTLSFFLS